MKTSRVATGSLVLAAALLAGTPALAASTATTTGVSATRNGTSVSVKDTASDNHSVYALVNNASVRLSNNNGAGATVSRNYGYTVTAISACVDIQFGPDTCSNWR